MSQRLYDFIWVMIITTLACVGVGLMATSEAKRKYYEQGFNDGHKSAINKVWESQPAESPKYIIVRDNGLECIPPCEFPRDSIFFQLSSDKK